MGGHRNPPVIDLSHGSCTEAKTSKHCAVQRIEANGLKLRLNHRLILVKKPIPQGEKKHNVKIMRFFPTDLWYFYQQMLALNF